MKKRGWIIILIITVLFTCKFASGELDYTYAAKEKSGTCGKGVTWKLDSKGTLTISGKGKIDDFAFYDVLSYKEIKKLVINKGITEIGDYAFEGLLTGVLDIPEGITKIGEGAFEQTKITSVNLPRSLKTIGDYAFAYSNIKGIVVIPSSIEKLGTGVFSDCYNITKVIYEEGTTRTGVATFANCLKLTEVKLSSTMQRIEGSAFAMTEVDENFVIPQNVKVIEEGAFYECYNIEGKFVIPPNVEEIGEEAFFQHWTTIKEFVVLNPNCKFPTSDDDLFSGTFIGYKGSSTEKYAREHHREFKTIESTGEKYVYPKVKAQKVKIDTLKIKLSSSKYTYNGNAKKPKISVYYHNLLLKENRDYTVKYKKNTYVGAATATVTGKGNYTGTLTKTFKIIPKSISKLTLSKNTYVYDGKTKKPTVTVKAGTLKPASKISKDTNSIDVTYASGRTKVGTYKVTVKGKGNYTGTLSKTFKINPKSTSITKVTKGAKSFTVKWSKRSTQTTGYQICYGTSTNRDKGKKVLVKSYKTRSKKITGLKKNKKYYVWVRTYKTVNGTKYFSEWSGRKYVVTK